MKRFIACILGIVFFILSHQCVFPQSAASQGPEATKHMSAKAIIEAAMKSTRKNFNIGRLESLTLEMESVTTTVKGNNEKSQSTGESRISIKFPDQIRFEVYTDFSTNQNLSVVKLDKTRFSTSVETLVDGKPFYFGSNLGSVAPKFTKGQQIASLRTRVFQAIFPITLETDLYPDLIFTYVGEAESRDGKANVIEVSEKDGNRQFRLFFEKKNQHLVMMVEKYFDSIVQKKEVEKTYYYSDFKEVRGILFPHKIVTQTGKFMTEELSVKKLEFNPSFKANFFEVKDEKINPF